MEIFAGHRALARPLVVPAVAIGNFDGVHLGHHQLLEAAVRAAQRLGGDAVVLTFDPHPVEVLAPHLAPPLITSRTRKLELLAAAGVTACVVEPFSRELASLEPEAFLQSILVDVFDIRYVVVGYDFTYGRNRGGNVDDLRAFGAARGIEVEIVDPVAEGGIVVSSTKIRQCLAAGDLNGAHQLLGRDFDVDGTVVRGAGRGATIGVPTANIEPFSPLLLQGGVYAVRVDIFAPEDSSGDAQQVPAQRAYSDRALPGVANLGTNPTFTDSNAMSLEVHLLDFARDLYGQTLRVRFVDRLRGEQRFPGVDALVQQIRADIERARAILNG